MRCNNTGIWDGIDIEYDFFYEYIKYINFIF